MKILQLLTATLALVSIAKAECDCKKAPFRPNPPCGEICIPKTLAQANEYQLVSILNLPADLSKKIMEYPNRAKATSLEQYKTVLSSSEMNVVKTKFRTLTQNQLDKFYSTKASNPQ